VEWPKEEFKGFNQFEHDLKEVLRENIDWNWKWKKFEFFGYEKEFKFAITVSHTVNLPEEAGVVVGEFTYLEVINPMAPLAPQIDAINERHKKLCIWSAFQDFRKELKRQDT
jgi:hypothetical protein